ncbi:MAG TPA: sulfur transferase domain-containing protein [Nevskiaceae bacterium]
MGAWWRMLFVDYAMFRWFFNLREEFAPGVYRSGHPMPYQLRGAARAGVKTVLSLRAPDADLASNRLEWDAARRVGMKVVHLPLASREAPSAEDVLGLVAAFQQLDHPLWIHCKSGADRVGFAAAVYRLAVLGRPIEDARRQLCFWWHGHVRQARTGILDTVLACYAQANARQPVSFVDWVRTGYNRDAIRRAFRARWWAGVLVDRLLRRE